jgi:hypothetical protein
MEAKWYVYELYDPRDDSVFYVGKGSGNRINAHESEAKNGVCSHKCNKIRSLWRQNLKVGKRKVAYFWNEADAYRHEAELITSYDNLTNVVLGPADEFVGPMPYVEPEKKEISLRSALEMLLVRPDILATFFKGCKGVRKKCTVSISGFHPVWNSVFTTWYELTFNHIYPMCLDRVVDSPTHWKMVQDCLLPYGVILENGCKNETNPIVG